MDIAAAFQDMPNGPSITLDAQQLARNTELHTALHHTWQLVKLGLMQMAFITLEISPVFF